MQSPDAKAAFPSQSTGDGAARLRLLLVEQAGDWRAFGDLEHALRCAAKAAAVHVDVRLVDGLEASVVLADDTAVRSMNRTYRGKDYPTNVLSFPYQRPPGVDEPYLGDIVLAAETVLREATERAVPPVHHVQHLVVHGVLHLLGYDHQVDAEADAMERLETEILASLGIADPYAASVA